MGKSPQSESLRIERKIPVTWLVGAGFAVVVSIAGGFGAGIADWTRLHFRIGAVENWVTEMRSDSKTTAATVSDIRGDVRVMGSQITDIKRWIDNQPTRQGSGPNPDNRKHP